MTATTYLSPIEHKKENWINIILIELLMIILNIYIKRNFHFFLFIFIAGTHFTSHRPTHPFIPFALMNSWVLSFSFILHELIIYCDIWISHFTPPGCLDSIIQWKIFKISYSIVLFNGTKNVEIVGNANESVMGMFETIFQFQSSFSTSITLTSHNHWTNPQWF